MPLTLPQSFSDVVDYRHLLWKWKWTVLLCAALVIFFTGYRLYREAPTYHTSAQIILSYAPPRALDVQDAFRPRPWEPRRQEPDIARLTLLSSRLLAERVIRKQGLLERASPAPAKPSGWRYHAGKLVPSPVRRWFHELAGAPTPPGAAAGLPVQDEQARLRNAATSYLRTLEVEPTETGLVTISLKGRNPDRLQEALRTHLEEFIKLDLELQYETSDEAREWIEQRLKEARHRLEASSLAIQRFAAEHGLAPEPEAFETPAALRTSEQSVAQYRQQIQEIRLNEQILQGLLKNPGIIESMPDLRVASPTLEQLKARFIHLTVQAGNLRVQYGPDHPSMVRAQNELRNARQQIREEAQRVLRSLETQRAFAEGMLERAQEGASEAMRDARRRADLRVRFQALSAQVESNRKVYEEVLAKLNLMMLMGNMKDDPLMSSIKVIDPPRPPEVLGGGGKADKIVKAAGMGLFLGIAVAFLLEFLDNVVRTPRDIQRFLNIPFLGFVPRFLSAQKTKTDPRGRSFLTIVDPSSPQAECIRNVRTNLVFSFPDRDSHTVLFTSPEQSNGKSTVVSQLAAAISQLGKKTLLVDTDLRKPTLHKIMGVENTSGVTDILIGEASLEEAIHATGIENLDFVSAGTIPPNPSELLGSDAMQRLIEQFKSRYDMVLFDSPPILPVVDAKVLGSLMDGVCIVPRSGQTTLTALTYAIQQIEEGTIRLLGAVLNDLDMTEFASHYGYTYGYYKDAAGEREEEVVPPSTPA